MGMIALSKWQNSLLFHNEYTSFLLHFTKSIVCFAKVDSLHAQAKFVSARAQGYGEKRGKGGKRAEGEKREGGREGRKEAKKERRREGGKERRSWCCRKMQHQLRIEKYGNKELNVWKEFGKKW